MEIKLIPVINLEFLGLENLECPKYGPYWDYADDWESYHKKALLQSGYTGSMVPYSRGSTLYELNQISDTDLVCLIQNLFNDIEEDEEVSLIEQLCSLEGGCVLNVDDVDILLPQCCSGLSDFLSWVGIFTAPKNHFYQGHPSPLIKAEGEMIIIDLINHQFKGENFSQKNTIPGIELKSQDLIEAIKKANEEFDLFRNRIKRLKTGTDWDIKDLENILVFNKEKIPHTM